MSQTQVRVPVLSDTFAVRVKARIVVDAETNVLTTLCIVKLVCDDANVRVPGKLAVRCADRKTHQRHTLQLVRRQVADLLRGKLVRVGRIVHTPAEIAVGTHGADTGLRDAAVAVNTVRHGAASFPENMLTKQDALRVGALFVYCSNPHTLPRVSESEHAKQKLSVFLDTQRRMMLKRKQKNESPPPEY